MKFRFRHQLFVGRAVESTEKECLFAHLLHHAASLTKALKHRVELVGRETTGQNVATLAMHGVMIINPFRKRLVFQPYDTQ